MARSGMDFARRAQLTELMDEPCSRAEMHACLRDLERVNRWLLGYRPTLHWLKSLNLARCAEPVRILDVGCGYGDTLRTIERWARDRRIEVELTGLDLNPDSAAIAAEATTSQSRIGWVTADVFTYAPRPAPHIVISSLFTHHLTDRAVCAFVRWMEGNTQIGWFINDLTRAPIPYYLFGWFARAMRLHPFVQHDGRVSIARGFIPNDWRTLCVEAGLSESQIEIRGFTPGRLCVSRRKLP